MSPAGHLRVLAVAGSSGGHIFPAVGFLEELKEKHKDIQVLLILPKNKIINSAQILGYKIYYIPVSALTLRPALKSLAALFNFFRGSLETAILLMNFKPDIVVGFGSLVSIPAIFFAWIFRIDTVIHEQNVSPGQANKLLSAIAGRIAVSFEETRNYLKVSKERIVFTGNPLRKSMRLIDKDKARSSLGLSPDKFTVLVMGGSQGSRSINRSFINAISGLSSKQEIQVIHLCGKNDCDYLKASYEAKGMKFRIFEFLDEMHLAYSAADLVFSRAGAITVSELMFFKLPAIIVPYPFARKHQVLNAGILKGRGAAVVLDESELESGRLKQEIETLLKEPQELEKMRSGYGSLSSGLAAGRLVDLAVSADA